MAMFDPGTAARAEGAGTPTQARARAALANPARPPRRREIAQLIPLSWRPDDATMRALRRDGIDAEATVRLYVVAMLAERVLHKRWLHGSFLAWVERRVQAGELTKGQPRRPEPGEEAVDEVADAVREGEASPSRGVTTRRLADDGRRARAT